MRQSDMFNILLDSGADAAVFSCSLAGIGNPSEVPNRRLQDASGTSITDGDERR